MLWVVAPIAAFSTALSIAVNCSKGRNDLKAQTSKKSDRALAAPPKAPNSKRSQKSTRSTKSIAGDATTAKPEDAGGEANNSKRESKGSERSSRPKSAGRTPRRVGPVGNKKTGKANPGSDRSKKPGSGRELKTPIANEGSQRKAAEPKSDSVRTAIVVDKAAASAANAAIAGRTIVSQAVPSLSLRMEPSEMRWNATGGIQRFAVENNSDSRKAIKVKCSDNLLYRVNPVHSFIEPGEAVHVDVLRQNGALKVDKIVVLATEAKKSETNARAVFDQSPNMDMMILPLIAT